MPPKRTGKGRRKASVKSIAISGDDISSQENGGVNENEALELPSNAEVGNEKAVMVPEAVKKRGRTIKSKRTKTVGSGEQLNGDGEAIDPEAGHFKNGHHDGVDVKEDASHSSKSRGTRRKAADIASESDAMANAEQAKTEIRAGRKEDQPTTQKGSFPETKETAPKKARGRNARQQSSEDLESDEQKAKETAPKNARGRNARQKPSEAAREDLAPVEELESEEQEAKEIAHETKEITSQDTKDSQSDKQLSADVESAKDKDSVPKKTRGRLAGDKSAPRKTKDESSTGVPGTVATEVDAEPKASKGVRGRKRKNVQTAPETGEVSESSKAAVEARILKVSLLRQKSVDDMALKEMKSNGKVKAAVGSSNPRGKRGREDDGDGEKSAKVSKASKAKLPKKGSIPDVSALDFSNASTTAGGESWNLKIVSWNINGIRAWLEKDAVSYLSHEQPDVVCFQETKCPESKLPEEAKVQGYHCYWLGGDKDGYSGVGLLSKKKPLSVEYGIGMEDHDSEGRVITADYEKFYLVAAYVPNSGRGLVRLEYRKQWDVDFRAYLKKLDQAKPVILCGDLNVAHQEIDLANPKTNKKNAGFTQEERDAFSALLSEGFVDAYRRLYPDTASAYTFWTYMMNARAKNVGWRIDYFVMSERFADHLCDCCIRKDVMGSDHCPLVLFLCV